MDKYFAFMDLDDDIIYRVLVDFFHDGDMQTLNALASVSPSFFSDMIRILKMHIVPYDTNRNVYSLAADRKLGWMLRWCVSSVDAHLITPHCTL